MEHRDQLLLEDRLEINQDVAAADEIELRKGRVAGHVLLREDAHVADRLGDLIVLPLLGEVPPEPLGRHVERDVLEVPACPRALDRRLARVAREDLNREVGAEIGHQLEEDDRDRIRLLARRAAGHPDAKRKVPLPVPDHLRKDPGGERLEGQRVAEEVGDLDQDVLIERLDLGGPLGHVAHVLGERVDLVEHHPPGDSPLDGRRPVVGEVDVAGTAKVVKRRFRSASAPARSRPPGRRAPPCPSRVRPAPPRPRCPARRGRRRSSRSPVDAEGISTAAAVESCSAKQMPPSALMAWTPSAPSVVSPESTTAIAAGPAAVATERNKASIGRSTADPRRKAPSSKLDRGAPGSDDPSRRRRAR